MCFLQLIRRSFHGTPFVSFDIWQQRIEMQGQHDRQTIGAAYLVRNVSRIFLALTNY